MRRLISLPIATNLRQPRPARRIFRIGKILIYRFIVGRNMRSLFWPAVERSWQLGIGAGRGNHSENGNPQGHFIAGLVGAVLGLLIVFSRASFFDVARIRPFGVDQNPFRYQEPLQTL
ncbi:MAG: hypothetical protein ACTHK9_01440 [Nitrobacter sp.]